MTEVSFKTKKDNIKKTMVMLVVSCLVLALVPILGYSVEGSNLNGVLPTVGCVTDGNAEAKKAMTTTGNGDYFHTYKAPTFTWAEDCKSCKATFVCERGDDTLEANCTITQATTVAATNKNDGKITITATVKVYEKTYTSTKEVVVPKASKISISTTKYNYTGKVKTPKVTVKDSKGATISSDNYTIYYTDNKKVGKGSVTVAFNGEKYAGEVVKTFTINPKGTALTSVEGVEKGFKATWTKKTTQVTGYQIRYSTDSNFSADKTTTIKIKKNSTKTKKVTKLSSGKTYYVQIRTYTTVDGKNYYSSWSEISKVKTK